MTENIKSIEQRQSILQGEINGYIQRGFRVTSQTQTSAQLVKPKHFSCLIALLALFLFGIGLVIYFIYYLAQKDETVYIEVDNVGQVIRNGRFSGLPSKASGTSTIKIGETTLPVLLVVAVVGMLLVFCCFVSALLGNTPTRPVPTQTTVTTSPVTKETATPIPTLKSSPTVGVSNTPTSVVTQALNNHPTSVIIDASAVVGSKITKVEQTTGAPTDTVKVDAGVLDTLPNGGETRTYVNGAYTVEMDVDKQGVVTGLQITDGLLSEGWVLDDWPILVNRVGMSITQTPDITAPTRYAWKNYKGYYVQIFLDKLNGNVWSVEVTKVQ